MSAKNWFWGVVEAILWYAFVYILLYTIKNPVDLYANSLILLMLAYAATIACPWFRKTGAWMRLWENKNQVQ